MFAQTVTISGHPLGFAHYTATEPRHPGIGFGSALRCWNCGTQIGERQGDTFLVSSNKVEVGGIPLAQSIWRRCRGGRSNPACRAINTLPDEWLKLSRVMDSPTKH